MGLASAIANIVRRGATPDYSTPAAEPATERKSWVQFSGYDAVKSKGKRTPAPGIMRDEDSELRDPSRRVLVSAHRSIHRNYSIAGWMIEKHLDYVTNFRFRCKTGDRATDQAVEAFIATAGHRENFDIAGRHGIHESVRMAEARRVVDGDVFMLKLSTGKVQWIEGDRIRTPFAGLPATIDPSRVNLGVLVDPDQGGKAIGYICCKRARTTDQGFAGQDMTYERTLRAVWVYHHAYWNLGRFDQVRGISPLASAYNTLQDTYEGIDLALAKAKVGQMFGLKFTRDASPDGDPIGNTFTTAESADGETIPECEHAEPEGPKYNVDFGKGPVLLDLDAGDDADFIESKNPSTEFQNFMQICIQIALKALNIPYSWFDESHTNFAGQKQATVNYIKSADHTRKSTRDLLMNWTRWRLSLAVDDGEIVLPKGVTLNTLKYEWKANGTPWLDPLKESLANIGMVEAGLASPIVIIEQNSDQDFEDVQQDQADFLAKRRELGLPDPTWAMTPMQIETANADAPGADSPPDKVPPPKNGKAANGRKSIYHEMATAIALSDREERLNGGRHA